MSPSDNSNLVWFLEPLEVRAVWTLVGAVDALQLDGTLEAFNSDTSGEVAPL